MSENTIRFGILGCGTIAKRFAKALGMSDCAELYACASRDPERAQSFAVENGASKAYGSYNDLLADPNVDAVYIATVHNTHADYAKLCINAGKPVLSEKPFFVNAKEASEVIAFAKEKNVLIMEGMWSRTQPVYLKVKEWISDGRIGDIKLIYAPFCFNIPFSDNTRNIRHYNPETAGGALLDAGVYPYEYVTGIMGGAPEEVVYMVDKAPTGVDATTAMVLRYPGALANCITSISASTESNATISGTIGSIRHYGYIGSKKAELLDPRGNVIDCIEDNQKEGFVYEIAHFVSLLREGKKESNLIPLKDTLDFAEKVDLVLGRKPAVKLPTRFTLDELDAHEATLRFADFTQEDAVNIGQLILQISKEDEKPCAVEIEVNGFEYFRCFPKGTTKGNATWMEKKLSTAQMTGHSSLRLYTSMAMRGVPRNVGMEPQGKIVPCGGGFPIMLKSGMVIGAIAVSGPAGDEYEHELVVKALSRYLGLEH